MKLLLPKIFLILQLKELLIRYRSILSGYLYYYTFADNRPRLRVAHTILKRSLVDVIKKKKKIRHRFKEVLERYGPNITLNITKKDGTKVSLDFKLPSSPPALYRRIVNTSYQCRGSFARVASLG